MSAMPCLLIDAAYACLRYAFFDAAIIDFDCCLRLAISTPLPLLPSATGAAIDDAITIQHTVITVIIYGAAISRRAVAYAIIEAAMSICRAVMVCHAATPPMPCHTPLA